MQTLELKIPPLILVAIIAALIGVAASAVPQTALVIPGKLWLAGVAGTAGLAIAVFGVWGFRRAHTSVDPRIPQQTTALVQGGVYRLSRNPMYLGFLLALTGWALYCANLLGFALLPIFVLYMNRFQIRPEERILREKFGESYRHYQRQVRRWL